MCIYVYIYTYSLMTHRLGWGFQGFQATRNERSVQEPQSGHWPRCFQGLEHGKRIMASVDLVCFNHHLTII